MKRWLCTRTIFHASPTFTKILAVGGGLASGRMLTAQRTPHRSAVRRGFSARAKRAVPEVLRLKEFDSKRGLAG